MNFLVQKIGGDASFINGKSENPNMTLAKITGYLLMKYSQKKELYCLSYQYAV